MSEKPRDETEARIKKIIERLYVESHADQRRLFRMLLLAELRRCQARDRQELLQPLLRDWETRIPKYRALLHEQKTAGVATDQVQTLLDNLLDLYRLLDSQSGGG